MECSICKQRKDSFVGETCMDCYDKKIGKENYIKSILKVQFFEGSILEIQDHMNIFFEREKIDRQRLVEIKYIKIEGEWGSKNSVMVVYV